MAQYADWWVYQKCWLIGGVPVFVIASEGAIGAVLPLMATQVIRRPPWLAFTIGAGLGVFMWAAAQVGLRATRPDPEGGSGEPYADGSSHVVAE